jgi:hypothetical protein
LSSVIYLDAALSVAGCPFGFRERVKQGGWELVAHVLPVLFVLAIAVLFAFALLQQHRERVRDAPLRAEIAAEARFEIALDRVRLFWTGGSRDRGRWIRIRKNGPMRLVVSPDAFAVRTPGAVWVFRGSESSIEFSQEPSRSASRDWIVITGPNGGRQVEIAISKKGSMQEIWHALAGTGAASGLRSIQAGDS